MEESVLVTTLFPENKYCVRPICTRYFPLSSNAEVYGQLSWFILSNCLSGASIVLNKKCFTRSVVDDVATKCPGRISGMDKEFPGASGCSIICPSAGGILNQCPFPLVPIQSVSLLSNSSEITDSPFSFFRSAAFNGGSTIFSPSNQLSNPL